MTTYKIQSGDTLSGIAKKYNTTVDELASVNGIKDKNLIYAGDTLSIPSTASSMISGGGSVGVTATKNNGTTGRVDADSLADSIGKWQSSRPTQKKSSYEDEIKGLLGELSGMKFDYDPSNDTAYKMIRDEMKRNARLAMEDTLGRASANTGGYANSYAGAAAQQAYTDAMAGALEYIPELYEAAYGRYDDDRNAALDTVKLLSDMSDSEFDKYNSLMKLYFTEGDMLFENFKDLSNEEFDRFLDYAELLMKQG